MSSSSNPKDNENKDAKSFLSGMKSDDAGATSLIGKNIHFKGELVGAEDLHVEGTIDGTVSMGGQNLSIGVGGVVSADIHAQNILINGALNGDVFADDLIEVSKSARVQGSLMAPRIKLEDGGKFNGVIDMFDSDQEKEERFNEFKPKLSPAEHSDKQEATQNAYGLSSYGQSVDDKSSSGLSSASIAGKIDKKATADADA